MRRNILVLLVICIYFSFFGCASGPKKIKFDELSSKTFTLYRVFYMTLMEENSEGSNSYISDLFTSLPIQDTVNEIEAKYGINVDTSLFSNDVSNVKSYNLAMRNYFIEHQTDALQRVTISFNRLNQEQLTVEIDLSIYGDDGSTTARNSLEIYIPYAGIIHASQEL